MFLSASYPCSNIYKIKFLSASYPCTTLVRWRGKGTQARCSVVWPVRSVQGLRRGAGSAPLFSMLPDFSCGFGFAPAAPAVRRALRGGPASTRWDVATSVGE